MERAYDLFPWRKDVLRLFTRSNEMAKAKSESGVYRVTEIIGTFVLVFVIFAFANNNKGLVGLGSLGALPVALLVLVIGLTAQFTFGTYFTRYARYFGGEGVQLIHHGIYGVFQLQNFAFYVHGDFTR